MFITCLHRRFILQQEFDNVAVASTNGIQQSCSADGGRSIHRCPAIQQYAGNFFAPELCSHYKRCTVIGTFGIHQSPAVQQKLSQLRLIRISGKHECCPPGTGAFIRISLRCQKCFNRRSPPVLYRNNQRCLSGDIETIYIRPALEGILNGSGISPFHCVKQIMRGLLCHILLGSHNRIHGDYHGNHRQQGATCSTQR